MNPRRPRGLVQNNILWWLRCQIGWAGSLSEASKQKLWPVADLIYRYALRAQEAERNPAKAGLITWAEVEKVRRKLTALRGKLTEDAYYVEARAKGPLRLSTPDEILNYWIERTGQRRQCWGECKYMYFCERANGHEGEHCEGGLVWD